MIRINEVYWVYQAKILVDPLLIEDILLMKFHDVSNVKQFLDPMDMILQKHQVHKRNL
jgi:hypothetical protein